MFGGRANAGKTIARVLLGWSFSVVAPMWAYERLAGRPVFAGVQTQLTSTSGSPLDPAISPLSERAYPLERWLWWEAAELSTDGRPSWTEANANVVLRTVLTLNTRDVETLVKNTAPVADLFVYVTASCPDVVNCNLEGRVTGYTSVLVRS